MTDHVLAAERLHFAWDNSLAPVRCVAPGDCVTFETWDASIHEIQRTWTSADAEPGVDSTVPPRRVGCASSGRQAALPARITPCTAHAPDLMQATRNATRWLIEWLCREIRLSAEDAYVLASVAAELRISQVVDAPNWTVTAFFPLGVLTR
jgi:acetamidase/formamidase